MTIRLYVGSTDQEWFDNLSGGPPLDEVNFWQPSDKSMFRALQPGEMFLFRLKGKINRIAGGGIFSHATLVPLSVAWQAFGTKNGTASQAELRAAIARYRDLPPTTEHNDPPIVCRILTQPFFWPRDLWLPVPPSIHVTVPAGMGLSTDNPDGLRLWHAVADRLAAEPVSEPSAPLAEAIGQRYGDPRLITPRLGQGAFRLSVTDNYERRCAVSGEKTLPILDAAHIRAYEAGGAHDLSNGLLLRTDIHRLFDLGYVTVAPDGRFEVSHRLKADFDNGKHYYDLHGTPLRKPRSPLAAPAPDALNWHRENRYLG